MTDEELRKERALLIEVIEGTFRNAAIKANPDFTVLRCIPTAVLAHFCIHVAAVRHILKTSHGI